MSQGPKPTEVHSLEEWLAAHEALFTEQAAKSTDPIRAEVILMTMDISRRLVTGCEAMRALGSDPAAEIDSGIRAITSSIGTWLGAIQGNASIPVLIEMLLPALIDRLAGVAASAIEQGAPLPGGGNGPRDPS
jgi:hypothetical protein